MRGIRYPHRRQLPGPIIPRQLQRIAPIGLHSLARFHRHQRWRHYFALRSQCRQLPVHNIPGGTCFITEPQLLHCLSFLTSFRIDSSRFGITPSDLISPSCSATATVIVSAWTSKPTNFILFIDRLHSLVALYCFSTDSQNNPRTANRCRSFHSD